MAITVPVKELQDAVLGAMSAPEAWLNRIADFDSIGGGLPVGTTKLTYLTDPTVNTVAKSDTANVADSGASTTANITTTQKYVPVPFYDYEWDNMTGTTFSNIAKKIAMAVLKTAGTNIIDAISDAVIAQTYEIYDTDNSRNNFASTSEAITGSNAQVLNNAVSDVLSNSQDAWILAYKQAWGNIRSMSRNVTAAPAMDGVRTTYWDGIPLYSSRKSGTTSKWGAAAKPCVIVGCNDAIGFGWKAMNIGDEITRLGNGLLTLQVSITYSYCLVDEDNLLAEVRNYDVT